MKKALILTALFGLFLVGCQDSNLDPISPPTGNMSISSVPDNTPVTLDKIDISGMQLNKWRNLYSRIHNLSRHSVLIRHKIWGALGGVVKINPIAIVKSDGKSAEVSATLSFDKYAIHGNTDIYMIVDADNACITFYPDIAQFNGNVKLDATIKGAGLSYLFASDTSKINFVYVPDDPGENAQVIKNKGIIQDNNTCTIGVIDALLKHFSRYSWATRTGDGSDR